MKRSAHFALLAVISGCFGQPEDLFSISGSVVDGLGAPMAGASVFLERDDGATDLICSSFSSFVTLTTDELGAFQYRVIRQQTRGRLSEHRCFRAFVVAPDGRRTTVVWPFTGDDVRVPRLKLWPDGENVIKNLGGLAASVHTLPDSWRFNGAGATPFVYRTQIDTEVGMVWRSLAAGNEFTLSPRFLAETTLGGRFTQMSVAALQRIERYDRDPFGQLKAAVFENRLEIAPVSFGVPARTLFPGRGSCALASPDGGCVLTDDDPTPKLLPANTRELQVDFGKAFDFGDAHDLHYLYIHRIWVDGPWTELIVDLSVEETPDFLEFFRVPIDKGAVERIQVSRDDPMPGLDLGDIPLRGKSLGFRRLRIRAVNQDQSVPIKSVGEVSVY